VLIDREEGGVENIRKYVDRIDAVLTRTEIMAIYSGETKGLS
jgi:orotate phosphoribosyltransferase (EC 2.4.2.10)